MSLLERTKLRAENTLLRSELKSTKEYNLDLLGRISKLENVLFIGIEEAMRDDLLTVVQDQTGLIIYNVREVIRH